jgi:hypothetical protein
VEWLRHGNLEQHTVLAGDALGKRRISSRLVRCNLDGAGVWLQHTRIPVPSLLGSRKYVDRATVVEYVQYGDMDPGAGRDLRRTGLGQTCRLQQYLRGLGVERLFQRRECRRESVQQCCALRQCNVPRWRQCSRHMDGTSDRLFEPGVSVLALFGQRGNVDRTANVELDAIRHMDTLPIRHLRRAGVGAERGFHGGISGVGLERVRPGREFAVKRARRRLRGLPRLRRNPA